MRVPEKDRITSGRHGSDSSYGNNGMFAIKLKPGVKAKVVVSDGLGWEHVSVTLSVSRCPTWDEMCFIKNLFWSVDETVIQYHPAQCDYINTHPYCLHLWRPINEAIPTPPLITL